jgi:hypothetical protein
MGKLSMEARKKERKCQLTREERRRKSYFSAGGETEDLFRMEFSPKTWFSPPRPSPVGGAGLGRG